MNRTLKIEKLFSMAALALTAALVCGSAVSAKVVYLGDGAVQNNRGGWDLPKQGTCEVDTNQKTRPDCVALRFDLTTYPDKTSCETAKNAYNTSLRSWTTGYCNDVQAAHQTQATCEGAGNRKWSTNNGGVCAIVLFDDDRNNVACALEGGQWLTAGACTGNWIMPQRDDAAYGVGGLKTGNSPGDQCLRCHNNETQYNGPRVRDTEDTLYMGHKNMSRPVTVGKKWGGPDFQCSNAAYTNENACEKAGYTWDPTTYPTDDTGNVFDWTNGKITVGSTSYDLKWIYGDWLASLPRAIYKGDRAGSCSNPTYTTETACATNGGTWTATAAAMSYSCARCHTTGWTSDPALVASKEPEKTFPGSVWDPTAKTGYINVKGGVSGDTDNFGSWDVWGISCSRCHNSVVDDTTNGGNPPFSGVTGMGTHHNNLTSPTGAACSDPRFTAQTQCQAAGATWIAASTATPACSVAGVCTVNGVPDPNQNATACVDAGEFWAAATDIVRCGDIAEYGREHGIAAFAAAKFTGTNTQRGMIITRLCMDCHRQEASGLPIGATAVAGQDTDGGTKNVDYTNTNPAGVVTVGPYHGTVTFISHPAGNQFLNSPHAKFSGKFDQIATGTFNYAMTGAYKSHFMADGEAAGTGNGCTGCHEVHTSTVAGERPFREECTECHAKSLSQISHPGGVGTPMENMAEPFEACVTCHMPGGQHSFRINPDASYSTFPMPAAMNGNVAANTASDGGYAGVWVDLDAACGQCHGGGSNYVAVKGTIAANSPNLTLTSGSTAQMVVGQKIRISGAGAFIEYEGTNPIVRKTADFDSYIKTITDATHLVLAGNSTNAATNVDVIQNATANGAGYISKASLATLAKGMHKDAPTIVFNLTPGTVSDPQNTLAVRANSTGTSCASGCDVYAWDFGDGGTGSTANAQHTYAAPGTYTIKLTVTDYQSGSGSVSKKYTAVVPNYPPKAQATCNVNANDWTAQIIDGSSDQGGAISTVAVVWGDGSMLSKGPAGTTFDHQYLNPGVFNITHKAIDTTGKETVNKTLGCSPAVFTYFTISGTVKNHADTAVVPGAYIVVKKDGVAVRALYASSTGTFTVGNLKPGNYQLLVTKAGYTFPVFPTPATYYRIGPDALNLGLNAN